MQHFTEADMAELAQVAREEGMERHEWWENNITDECIVGEDDDE